MALGTITLASEVGREGSNVMLLNISVPGDGAYPTGGTPGFQALVRAKVGQNVEVMAVMQQNIGDLRAMYDKVNDKLIVDVMSTGVQVANAVNLAGTTFKLLVFAK